MGQVYRARDTRLGRDVALKVMAESASLDRALLARFEQEARLAGSLNHPNIVVVFDVGFHEGSPFLVTELLQGETLRERLAKGPVALEIALDWATQMATGLAAAHARSIVHRDVKPENVFLTRDAHVKLLDFGIAKLAEGANRPSSHQLLESTVTPAGGVTSTGQVLGTPTYMSPEQIRGEVVDARTDLFSFGAVLYEMVAGHQAFPGGTAVEAQYAILHSEPETLPAGVPHSVARVVRHCLEKERDKRFQSAGDLAFDLEALCAPTAIVSVAGVRKSGWQWRSLAVPVALFGLLATAILIAWLQPSRVPVSPTSETVTFRPIDFTRTARFTPDGRVLFTTTEGGTLQLVERNLTNASIQPLQLQGMVLAATSSTNELAVFLTSFPLSFWPRPATLARVPGGGGTPQAVVENVVSADWSPSGELAIVRKVSGGFAVEYPLGKTLFQTTAGWVGNLRVSPRGDLVAFIQHLTGDVSGEAVILDREGRRRRVSRHWHRMLGLAWSPRDEVWFSAGMDLPTEIQAMPVEGRERNVYTALLGITVQDISRDGSVLVGQGFYDRDITFLAEGAPNPRSLGWNDRVSYPRLSADGRLVLFTAWDTRSELVAMLRRTNGAPAQMLGDGAGLDLSPDGGWALLSSPGGLTIVATGASTRRAVPVTGLELGATRFLAGTNRAISVARASTDSDFRLYSIDLGGSGATPLFEPGADKNCLELSPDGTWAATRATDDGKQVLALYPLDGGPATMLPELGPDVLPAGWAGKDELWVARVAAGADPSTFGLIRFDVRRRAKVEQRTIGTGGSGFVISLHVTPDGKNVVFHQERLMGHLLVVHGLSGAR